MKKSVKLLISLCFCITLWQWLSVAEIIFIPSPLEVAVTFGRTLFIPEPIMGRTLVEHASTSIGRVLLGFFLAFSVALVFAIIFGYYRFLKDYCVPILNVIRPIPPIAWIPISILIFGPYGPLCIVFIGAFFPCFSSSYFAITHVDQEWLDYGRQTGASRFQMLRHIVLPACLPQICDGICIGLGVAWMCIIAAEMVSFSSSGLGYFIMVMYDVGKVEHMIAGMLAIAIIGYILNEGVSIIMKRFSYER